MLKVKQINPITFIIQIYFLIENKHVLSEIIKLYNI